MSTWKEAMAYEVASAIDDEFGETVTIKPMVSKPNYGQVPDRARPPLTLTAVFTWKSAYATELHNEHARFPMTPPPGSVSVMSRKPVFSFSRVNLPYSLKHGDIIERCCSGELFELHSIKPDGVSRIECTAHQLGLASQ